MAVSIPPSPPGAPRPRSGPKGQYDRWASKYDQETSQYGWCAPHTLLAALAEFAPPQRGQKVLDVGVGTGLASQPYVEGGAHVTGLDLSATMLDEIRKKKLPYRRLAEYDINQPLRTAGVKPATMDVVVSCGTLHFARDLDGTLRELVSALKPGGTLAFTYIPTQARSFAEHTVLNSPRAVVASLRGMDLQVLKHSNFIAYYDKGNSQDPVKYQLAVVRKPL